MRDTGRVIGVHSTRASAEMQVSLFERIDRDDGYPEGEVIYSISNTKRDMFIVSKVINRKDPS